MWTMATMVMMAVVLVGVGLTDTMETKVVDKMATRVVDKMTTRLVDKIRVRRSGGRQGEEMEAENELVRLQQAIGQY